MAALRHTARKLLLHRRPQASAAVERRLLHGSTPNSVERTAKIVGIQDKLQGKELYSLLAEVQREGLYMPNTRYGEVQRNLKLLQCLSVQVNPRPHEPKWRLYRATHVMNSVLICAAVAIVVHVGHAAAVRQWDDFKRGWEASTADAGS